MAARFHGAGSDWKLFSIIDIIFIIIIAIKNVVTKRGEMVFQINGKRKFNFEYCACWQ